MKDFVCVAFLQNMWVKNPDQIKGMIERDTTGQLRSRMIKYALFAGCVTGRRLRAAFGDWCDRIIWDEANPVIADNPKDYHAPDETHIASVLKKHNPQTVLCFTRAGEAVLRKVCNSHGIEMFLPVVHPACRHASTVENLNTAAKLLRTYASLCETPAI